MLCPGFIDLHTHSALRSFDDPLLTPKLAQGFTTEVINPDGLAPAPVAPERRAERQAYLRPLEGGGPETWPWSTVEEYLDELDATRPALSLVPSIGHGAVRDLVLGGGRVEPTAESLRAMRREVRIGLEAGARMLSFGLVYLPGAYAATDELVAVAEEAAAFGVPLVPHVRNEGNALLEAVAEMIDVARRSGAPLHVSHLKSLADERQIEPLLALLESAAAELDVTFDQYPYGAGSTLLASILPGWAQEGGATGTLRTIGSRDDRRRIALEIANGLAGWENILGTLGPRADRDRERGGAERGRSRPDARGYCSRARHRPGRDRPRPDERVGARRDDGAALRLRRGGARDRPPPAPARRLRRDLRVAAPSAALRHCPRFLGRFAIQDGLLPIEEAVARLTARAADRLGLTDRGRIAVGRRADLVLLDPTRYIDTATYADPTRSPEGVAGVWVNGVAALRDGVPTGARPGGVVR